MIVMATGHAGLDAFVRSQNPEGVLLVERWAEVQGRVGEADKIFIGENVPDFGEAHQWFKEHGDQVRAQEVVVWVSDGSRAAPWVDTGGTRIVSWQGEIDAQQLQNWWTEPGPLPPMFGPRWLLLSLYPYPSVASVAQWMEDAARTRYGLGGWVDMDLQRAELSITFYQGMYERGEFPFERLRPQRLQGRYLVAAPPPWLPGIAPPDPHDLDTLLRIDWKWQGWCLGSQLGRREVIHLLQHVPQVILWGSDATPNVAVERTVEFCRLYNGALEPILVTDKPRVETRSIVPSWCLERSSPPLRKSREAFWNSHRRKKG